MEANETLLQIGLQYCRLPTHTDTKETYSTLHIQPHRCTRVCVMCYFDSLLLPLQSLAHFLSTNHLSPSPSFSFRLPPTRRWEGKEEERRGGRKRERERRRGGDRELGENSGWGEEKLKKMEKDKGERERHAAITPVAGKFVEAQIRADFPEANFVEGHFLRASSDVRVNSIISPNGSKLFELKKQKGNPEIRNGGLVFHVSFQRKQCKSLRETLVD